MSENTTISIPIEAFNSIYQIKSLLGDMGKAAHYYKERTINNRDQYSRTIIKHGMIIIELANLSKLYSKNLLVFELKKNVFGDNKDSVFVKGNKNERAEQKDPRPEEKEQAYFNKMIGSYLKLSKVNHVSGITINIDMNLYYDICQFLILIKEEEYLINNLSVALSSYLRRI